MAAKTLPTHEVPAMSVPPRRVIRLAWRGLALALLLALLGTASALADAPFGAYDLTVSSSTTQAGGHPDLTTGFALNTVDDPSGVDVATDPPVGDPGHVPHTISPTEPLRDVHLALPAGLVGDPTHVPQCDPAIFGAGLLGGVACPDDSAVGIAHLLINLGYGGLQDMYFPVYNLRPSDAEPAAFGFSVVAPNVEIRFAVRASDGGLTAVISGINQAARIFRQSLTLWGVPADPSHDAERGACLTANTADDGDPSTPPPATTYCPVAGPRVPLLRNPTTCTGEPLTTTLDVASWTHPDRAVRTTATSPAVTGCDAVPFQPTIALTPDGGSADAPTGLDVKLDVAQNRDPDGLGASDLRRAVVTLPEGYSISPSAADGLQACDAQHVGVGGDGPADCPAASRIGSATIQSPILASPLSGPIYLGPSPSPGKYQVFLVVEGSGVRLKLPGEIATDPTSGRITATFDQTPQQPFDHFTLHFDGGDRAVLAAPATCGTAEASATLVPWSGTSPVTATAPMTLAGGACPGSVPFAPQLSAGMVDARAGSDSAFALTVARDDRTQPLGAITSVTLPKGLTAHVGAVPHCGAAAAAAGTCPEASRVGKVVVSAGAGAHPFGLTGTAYLTDGYKGAPFGLSLVVPAIAGPYNLGTVVIRSAIEVAHDTQITVKTDPLPQVLAGIPLRLRAVGLVLDRPGFMAPPTSCIPSAVQAVVSAPAGGPSATLSSRFAMSGCSKLKFTPKMAIKAVASTKQAGAGLHVALTQPAGQANLKAVAVSLPKQIVIKLKALGKVCTAAQLAAIACPAASKVGGASATTPLLSQPLKGAVYLVQSGKSLPQLVPVLQGSGLTVPLIGATTFSKARLGTAFAAIPDVPIRTFDLDLPHNKRAFLETQKLPCRGAGAVVTFTAQNGAHFKRTVPVTARCAKPASKAKSTKKKKA
ncbi:hypothetical protein DSM104299_05500 [Baekduia alba]|uniref:hypothetical protein n=1 Tax=Baekduia alba TaxID=2997333 RepID=UPI002341220F|nr:hypothetical protein [Baekduia alba]WCB96734.1 hypothetical protein DSM104299_05500 [Baekduia alba]